MAKLNFTVDSALIEELGRRLVGKPYIALAELVKNGYDADANRVTIEFMPEKGYIRVLDDGHGMTFEEFRDFWMRIGTIHKFRDKYSQILHRPMTGSKGVGRLSVQLLADRLTLRTVPRIDKVHEKARIIAKVDWPKAIKAGELISASVSYTVSKQNLPFPQGTELILRGLRHKWGVEEVRQLANEIWWLQPPFGRVSDHAEGKEGFEVVFVSSHGELKEEFDKQRDAIFPQFDARIEGRCEDGNVVLSLGFSGEREQQTHHYSLLDFEHNKIEAGRKTEKPRFDPAINLNCADFEIRIYSLVGRLKNFVRVDVARDYFDQYGGIQVYDGGFRLPHYGLAENDWLRVEVDHAHRLFLSELLPASLQESYMQTERLRFLPTLRRVLGVVKVDTASEPNLDISITRDRLVESTAYRDLVSAIRYALDYYAYEAARRHYEKMKSQVIGEPIGRKMERIEDVLTSYRQQIPDQAYDQIHSDIRRAADQIKSETETAYEKLALLGPLATVGIATLAYQHELRKQFKFAEEIIDRIRRLDVANEEIRSDLASLANDLDAWLRHARATNTLFDYMSASENTQEKRNFKLKPTIEEILRQLAFFSRGIDIDLSGFDDNVYLPKASFAEWGAIFQNIFTNAFNAMQASDKRLLQVGYRAAGSQKSIVIQDTGTGVDLTKSELLFQPFERQGKITKERMELGYGGSGLGLTIVRLLGERLGIRTRFIRPEDGFSTAFLLGWEEA